MSKLRPECKSGKFGTAIPDDTALFLIWRAVSKRRSLIHGKLSSGDKHCAMGCFWEDHPTSSVNTALVDMVAQVNDSIPPTVGPGERWRRVNEWLKWKLKKVA